MLLVKGLRNNYHKPLIVLKKNVQAQNSCEERLSMIDRTDTLSIQHQLDSDIKK
jgi:hypothetical protein